MKVTLRVTLFTLIFLSSFIMCFSQDKIKLSVNFVNTEFNVNPGESLENLQGISVDADARIFHKNGFRLGGVFNFQRPSIGTEADVYSFGPQLSYRAGPVEPFASALFGLTTDYSGGPKVFTRTYRAGVDVIFHKESNFFLRPFFVQWRAIEGFNTNVDRGYGAGAGFRF